MLEYSHSNSDSNVNASLQIPDNLYFDIFLMKVRSMTLYNSAEKAKKRINLKQELQIQIKVLLELFNAYHLELHVYANMLNDLQIELEELRKEADVSGLRMVRNLLSTFSDLKNGII
jgi:hypothetical protein